MYSLHNFILAPLQNCSFRKVATAPLTPASDLTFAAALFAFRLICLREKWDGLRVLVGKEKSAGVIGIHRATPRIFFFPTGRISSPNIAEQCVKGMPLGHAGGWLKERKRIRTFKSANATLVAPPKGVAPRGVGRGG